MWMRRRGSPSATAYAASPSSSCSSTGPRRIAWSAPCLRTGCAHGSNRTWTLRREREHHHGQVVGRVDGAGKCHRGSAEDRADDATNLILESVVEKVPHLP